MEKILIVGLGDRLRGDDGLGCFVIRNLKKRNLPKNVDIEDFGSGVFSLINKFKEYDKIIVVDAIKSGGKPGEIYKLELNEIENKKITNLHEVKIDKIILISQSLGIKSKIIFIGCEPKNLDYKIGLSKEVRDSIPYIINLIIDYIK